ncbi:MAG: hypothetical protein ACE5FV_02620 [Woeseia sp.]
MKRILLTLIVGVALGAGTAYLLVQGGATNKPLLVRPEPIRDVPKMSVEDATAHRDDSYVEIKTIEDTLALPTDFAQTEALYVLAGRSDSRQVQDLIYQASLIADPSDRRGGLQILFSRLAELDPRSALALAQTRDYAADRQLEATVWAEWGRNDLDNALIAASGLASNARRNVAAQAFYAAYGYGGNETVSHIEDALDIPPSRTTKAQFLYSLANRSPIEAVAYINEQKSPQDQRTLLYWLGTYLGQQDPETARQYADLFEHRQNREYFLRAVTNASAESSPETLLETALSQNWNRQNRGQAISALSQLTTRDPDKAMTYLSRARNQQERLTFAGVIAQGTAQSDPDRALLWAMENDRDGAQNLYVNVLQVLSQQDPQRALDAAAGIENLSKRKLALQSVLSAVAQSDPMMAVRYLDLIENKEIGQAVTMGVVQAWVQVDPQAAIDWVLTRDVRDQQNLFARIGSSLVHLDPREALRLLPRLDEQTAAGLRIQIVSQLAAYGSLAEAQGLVSQYEGHEEYSQMFAALIRATASSDFQAALRMAHSLADSNEKDRMMSQLAQQRIKTDPADSVRMLALINNEQQRLNTTTQLARYWQRQDEHAASVWARNLPAGAQRDAAIAGLASGWQALTPSRKLLLAGIGDLERRRQAQVSVLYQLARSDPDAVERLMLEFDLPEQYRQQVESMMRQRQAPGVSFGRERY